jgi:ubiquinone/menaquinone biosynthesis C-methylase UbiE
MKRINYQKVEKFWNESATNSTYDDDIQTGMLNKNKLAAQYRKYKEEEHFDRIINLRKDMNVLEVGCGTGRWAFYMAPKVKKVVAIDLSENMIDIAKNKQKNENVNNIEFYCGSASEFDADEKFNLVYFSGVLPYISDDDINDLLNKLPKWMDKGGVCLSRDSVSLKKRIDLTEGYPVIYRTRGEYIKIFKKNNLYLTYNEENYKQTMSSFASAYFLNRFFPNSRLRILILLEKLIRPLDIFLRFFYEKIIPRYGFYQPKFQLSHDFFIYKFQ